MRRKCSRRVPDVACVEFHEHDWRLSGIGHLICERWERAWRARRDASDRARGSSGVETNKANDRADRKCDSGATSEIAAHVSAKCQAADSQSDESHGLAEDRSGAIPPCCGRAARRLTQMARAEFQKHGWLLPGFGHLTCGQCASWSAIAPVSCPGPPRGSTIGAPGRGAAILLQRAPVRTPAAERAR